MLTTILSLSPLIIAGLSSVNYYGIYVFGIGVIISASFRALIVLSKLVSYGRQLKKFWNLWEHYDDWIEGLMLVFSIIFVAVYRTPCLCPTGWQWQLGVVAVLLVWIDLIVLIRSLQFLDIGNYHNIYQ